MRKNTTSCIGIACAIFGMVMLDHSLGSTSRSEKDPICPVILSTALIGIGLAICFYRAIAEMKARRKGEGVGSELH